MRRAALSALFLAAALAAGPAVAEPALLKPSALIDGDVIRIGDLFDNAGKQAGNVVAPAPQPGRRVVLDADWLAAVAVGHGVDWQPLTRAERLVLERRSTVIGAQEIGDELKRALALHGVAPDAELQLANRTVQMHLPADAPAALEVRDVDYDERTGRFAATVEAGGSAAQRLRVSGRVFTVTEIPVLARAMQKGEVVGDGDIEWKPVRELQMQRGILTELDQVVGQQLRHSARPGQALRATDVQRPVLVAKGSAVTMVLRSGGLSLTAQGRAVEDGGRGDTIRVTNSHSKITVEAKVQGPGMVSVLPPGHVLAN